MVTSLAVLWLLSGAPDAGPAVPCETVAQCWLDPEGRAIPRPKRFQGRPLPRGDCGEHLLWLRYRLTCQQNVCVSTFVGDRC